MSAKSNYLYFVTSHIMFEIKLSFWSNHSYKAEKNASVSHKARNDLVVKEIYDI